MDFKTIINNWIVKNILLAAGAVILLMLAAQFLFSRITQHNKEIEVQDLTSMTVYQAFQEAEAAGMRVEVVDSVYVRRMPGGSVVRQEPKAGAMVKKGRRIQLTINATRPKQIPMPNLIGYSFRSAKADLQARGLELGKLIYVSDIATNNVLRQLYRNREIQPGRMIGSGSSIDLVLGLNSEDCQTFIPNVGGMKYRRAIDIIQENSLNVGRVIFDKRIRNYQDSVNAVVFNQYPNPGIISDIGNTVTIYLTNDENKILGMQKKDE